MSFGLKVKGPPSKTTGVRISSPCANPPMVCLAMGMEGGESDICLRNTLVQQRLDIGLRVNTAAAGDIVDAGSISCQLIHLFRRCLENRSDLVDEGTGSAGTASVHAHVCDI